MSSSQRAFKRMKETGGKVLDGLRRASIPMTVETRAVAHASYLDGAVHLNTSLEQQSSNIESANRSKAQLAPYNYNAHTENIHPRMENDVLPNSLIVCGDDLASPIVMPSPHTYLQDDEKDITQTPMVDGASLGAGMMTMEEFESFLDDRELERLLDGLIPAPEEDPYTFLSEPIPTLSDEEEEILANILDPSPNVVASTPESNFQDYIQNSTEYTGDNDKDFDKISTNEEEHQKYIDDPSYQLTAEQKAFCNRFLTEENCNKIIEEVEQSMQKSGYTNNQEQASREVAIPENELVTSYQQPAMQNNNPLQNESYTNYQPQNSQHHACDMKNGLVPSSSQLQTSGTMQGAMLNYQPSTGSYQLEHQSLSQPPKGQMFTLQAQQTGVYQPPSPVDQSGYAMDFQRPLTPYNSAGAAQSQWEHNYYQASQQSQNATYSNGAGISQQPNDIPYPAMENLWTANALSTGASSSYQYNDLPVGGVQHGRWENGAENNIDSTRSQEADSQPKKNSHTWTNRPDYRRPRVRMTEEECNWLRPGQPERKVFKTARAKAAEKRRKEDAEADAQVLAGKPRPRPSPQEPIKGGFHISYEELKRLDDRRRSLGMMGRSLFIEKPQARKDPRAYADAMQRLVNEKKTGTKRKEGEMQGYMGSEVEPKRMRGNDGHVGELTYKQHVQDAHRDQGIQRSGTSSTRVPEFELARRRAMAQAITNGRQNSMDNGANEYQFAHGNQYLPLPSKIGGLELPNSHLTHLSNHRGVNQPLFACSQSFKPQTNAYLPMGKGTQALKRCRSDVEETADTHPSPVKRRKGN